MKRIFPLLILLFLAVISILIGLPACDTLVTEENTIENFDTVTLIDSTCVAACHSDQNYVLDIAKEEWGNSAHAAGQLIEYQLIDYTVGAPVFLATNVCGPQCHTSQGYTAQSTNNVTQPIEIRCKTCHDYHTTWDYTLRYDDPVTLMDGTTFDKGASNNCASCHKSIRNVYDQVNVIFDANAADSVAISDFWGPHGSNQAEMFLGRGGYHYEAIDYDNLTHGTSFDNGCIKCHVSVTTGFSLGGHSMNMTDNGTEHIASCNVIGCHSGSTAIDDFGVYSHTVTLQNFLDSLAELEFCLDSLGLLDTIGYVRPEEVVGALYNYRFIKNDQSNGIHNPKYSLRLASSSLIYLRAYINSLNTK